jgi:hypothetical protein
MSKRNSIMAQLAKANLIEWKALIARRSLMIDCQPVGEGTITVAGATMPNSAR